MTGSFFAKAKDAALMPSAIAISILQAGCEPFTKNGDFSGKSIYVVVGTLVATLSYVAFDALRNHAANLRISERIAWEERLARLEAEENAAHKADIPASPPVPEQQKDEKPAQNFDGPYKSWYDMPGMKRRPTGRDEPEREAPVFKTWDEAIGGRRYTNSFGKDSPDFTKGPKRMTVCNSTLQGATRKGAPAPILWR